jgi:hypothetical protein
MDPIAAANFTLNSPNHSSQDGEQDDYDFKPNTAATTKKPNSKIFRLNKGYIRFKPGAPYEERRLYWQRIQCNPLLKEKLKKPASDCWMFYNRKFLSKGMSLYGSQVNKLMEVLPEAYHAYQLLGDTSYREIISENKTQLLVLEINPVAVNNTNDDPNSIHVSSQLVLALKKYYKPEDKADDEDQDWLPTSNSVPFDPELDDPDALLNYILTSSDA